MKIIHLMSHEALNGVATSTRTLIEEQMRAGYQIMLVHLPGAWIETQVFPRPLELLATNFAATPSEIRRVGNRIRAWDGDLIHAHGSKANKYGMVYRSAAWAPTVMTAHARQFQLPWRFAHAVIAPSQQTADYYLERFLVPARRLHIVPHMFNVDSTEPVTEAGRRMARDEFGIDGNTLVLGSIGDLGVRKNQADMLRILKMLVSSGIDARLLLIGATGGGGKTAAGFAELIADPVIADRVHLAGVRADAPRLLHALDIYLCTSRVEEGPIATLEAMATCLPVLTVDVGYSSALIRDGLNGRLFPIGAIDAIAEAADDLAGDPDQRAAMGKAARRTLAEQIAPAAIIPRIEDVYRAAIVRAGPRPSRH